MDADSADDERGDTGAGLGDDEPPQPTRTNSENTTNNRLTPAENRGSAPLCRACARVSESGTYTAGGTARRPGRRARASTEMSVNRKPSSTHRPTLLPLRDAISPQAIANATLIDSNSMKPKWFTVIL